MLRLSPEVTLDLFCRYGALKAGRLEYYQFGSLFVVTLDEKVLGVAIAVPYAEKATLDQRLDKIVKY